MSDEESQGEPPEIADIEITAEDVAAHAPPKYRDTPVDELPPGVRSRVARRSDKGAAKSQ